MNKNLKQRLEAMEKKTESRTIAPKIITLVGREEQDSKTIGYSYGDVDYFPQEGEDLDQVRRRIIARFYKGTPLLVAAITK